MARKLGGGWGEDRLGMYNLLAVVSCGFTVALGAITKQWGFWTNLKDALHKSQLLAICPTLVEGRVCFPGLLFPLLQVKTNQAFECPALVFRGGWLATKP